jgi:hypothetical protein
VRQPSHVKSTSYSEQTHTLTVVFDNDAIYDYYNVPPALYKAFQAHGFSGGFLNKNIKGIFKYTQVQRPRTSTVSSYGKIK